MSRRTTTAEERCWKCDRDDAECDAWDHGSEGCHPIERCPACIDCAQHAVEWRAEAIKARAERDDLAAEVERLRGEAGRQRELYDGAQTVEVTRLRALLARALRAIDDPAAEALRDDIREALAAGKEQP